MQRKFCRRQRNPVHHQATVETHHLGIVVNLGAGCGQHFSRTLVHHAHAIVFKQGQRGVVDLLDLVRAQNFKSRIGVDRLAPGKLINTARRRP